MKYNVHVAPTTDIERLGAEIQPPISDMAFKGIKKVLAHPAYGSIAPNDCLVEMTRNDAEGTAFTLCYGDVNDTPEEDVPFDLLKVAQQIADLLNPAGLHEVQLHLPAS